MSDYRHPAHALDAWDCDLNIPQAEYDRMLDHPHLQAASRALAQSTLDAGARDETLLGIFKDAGRYLAAMWAIQLHLSGGLTLARLKDLCARSTFLSPGRAQALLLYMRYLGYIVPVRDQPPKSQKRFVPTPRFVQAWTLHMESIVSAICVMEPDARRVLDALHIPEVFACLVCCQGESLFNATAHPAGNESYYRVFIHSHAGTQILAVMLTGDPAQPFPPLSIASPSLSATSARFGVSRVHLRRLLKRAQTENMLHMGNDRVIHFSETARDQIRTSYAMQLRHLLMSTARAAQVARALGTSRDDAEMAVAE